MNAVVDLLKHQFIKGGIKITSLKELIDLRIHETEMEVETSNRLCESHRKEYLITQTEYECNKNYLRRLRELKKQYIEEFENLETRS